VTQKVQEAEPARAKLKGKAKAKVINEAIEEAQRERLEKLKAERAVIQEMIDQLES
jgi:cell division protein FtsB